MSTNTGKLTGKVALVTGASKGIGASIAKHLAAEGAAVAVNYSSSKEGADKVVAEIAANGGKAVAVGGSVAKKSDIDSIVAETKSALGPIDILVNNAGVYEFQPLEQITEESFHWQFGVNVLGLLLMTQEAVKVFNSAGGSIINIGSVAGAIGMPGSSVYGSTKASVDLITKVLSKELGPKGIRVNAINPGMVETEGATAAGFIDSDFRKQIEAQTPVGRIGQPADIATAAVFLASPDSSWISGETLYIAGGYPVLNSVAEIERFLHVQIPLARAMGIRVESFDAGGLVLSAPLGPNHNHLGTAFGGSLAAIAMLAGYALVWLELGDRESHVVIRDSAIRYLRPVRGDIRATCARPGSAELGEFKARFGREGKARLPLHVVVEDNAEPAVEFDGTFVALAAGR